MSPDNRGSTVHLVIMCNRNQNMVETVEMFEVCASA